MIKKCLLFLLLSSALLLTACSGAAGQNSSISGCRQRTIRYSNYPMQIETGQVFVVDYTKADGSVERHYYRSDGKMWNGEGCTEEITVGE